MSQESSKLVWPKPAGGYQSETGRRYGRRHAYVSYRPSTNRKKRITSLRSKKTEAPMHRSAPSQIKRRSRSPFAATRRRWDNRESSGAALNAETEDYSRFPPREYRASGSRRGMPYGHTDTLRADESEEEAAGPVDWLPARGKPGKFKDDKPCDPEKGARALAAGAPSRFSSFNRDLREELAKVEPAPAARRSAHRAELLKQNGATAQTEGRAAAKGDSSERERRGQNAPAARASRAPGSVCSGGEGPARSAEEPVVRPKVRNLSTPNCMKPKVFFDTDDDEDVPHSASRWRDAARAEEDHLDGLARRGRGGNPSHPSEPKYPEDKRDARNHQLRREKQPRRRRALAEPDLWTYHDDYYRYYEDDSDSDKEWMAALRRKYRSREQPQAPGADRWEASPGKEEREAQRAGACAGASAGASAGACAGASAGVSARASARACARACASAAASSLVAGATAGASVGSTGSSYLEEAQERPLLKEGRASLEEGEIPWLQYHENESSSEGDNESSQELIQPAMFLLDGNNNLEDDSSVSEDLEVDWSLFDGFADGLGVAEAISYVDPQFLTYMALEERLAQAMETALAHLESLAVDVEVANPPASKESIDALPEIVVTEDHGAVGQEMCCPICCSEYVKGEVATELPCHHYFHKPCVSIWLQKSGTCPVCRCMLPPPM